MLGGFIVLFQIEQHFLQAEYDTSSFMLKKWSMENLSLIHLEK